MILIRSYKNVSNLVHLRSFLHTYISFFVQKTEPKIIQNRINIGILSFLMEACLLAQILQYNKNCYTTKY